MVDRGFLHFLPPHLHDRLSRQEDSFYMIHCTKYILFAESIFLKKERKSIGMQKVCDKKIGNFGTLRAQSGVSKTKKTY